MASGTVGYTDTRGNKDFTSIIASQIGRRLKEASNMASEERAYAAGVAEAGGTSLEEAGIGRGFFFKRALGSRFGGDKIARTRGRLSSNPSAGRNPAGNFKSRFRGGFDYNITNQTITDTAPISNALVTGLRGVQGGLIQVSAAISKQDAAMSSLASSQADMAKAIMFNGYLFQMFMSQQKGKSGRSSLAREERSIERGFSGGGGSGSGGGGGGFGRGARNMINVTPGGMSRRGASGFGGGAGGFDAFDAANFALGRKNLLTTPANILQAGRYGRSKLTGQAFNVVSDRTVLGALADGKIAGGLSRILGTKIRTGFLSSLNSPLGERGVKGTLDVIEAAAGTSLSPNSANALINAVRGQAAGKMGIMDEMLDAQARVAKRSVTGARLGTDAPFLDRLLKQQTKIDDFKHLNTFRKTAGITRKQAKILNNLGLSAGEFDTLGNLIPGSKRAGIVDDILQYYPNVKFKNVDEAVALTQFARLIDNGENPRKAIKIVRGLMGPEVADRALMSGSRVAARNTMVGKSLQKIASRNALMKGIAKKIPVISAIAGTAFALGRIREGDFMGAALEFGSGMAGLFPGLGTKISFGLDAYLLSRDLGLMPFERGGVVSPRRGKGTRMMIAGLPSVVGEGGTPEMVAPLDKKTSLFFGEGIIEAMKKRQGDYNKVASHSVFSGLQDAQSGGIFEGLVTPIGDQVSGAFNSMKEFVSGSIGKISETIQKLNPVNLFKSFVPGTGQIKDAVSGSIDKIKNFFNFNKDTSDISNGVKDGTKIAGLLDFLQNKSKDKIDELRYDTGDTQNPHKPGSILHQQFERFKHINEIDPDFIISSIKGLGGDKDANNLLNLSRETSNKNMGTTIINNSNVVAGGPGGNGNEEGEEVFFGSSVANDFSSFIPMFIEATV